MGIFFITVFFFFRFLHIFTYRIRQRNSNLGVLVLYYYHVKKMHLFCFFFYRGKFTSPSTSNVGWIPKMNGGEGEGKSERASAGKFFETFFHWGLKSKEKIIFNLRVLAWSDEVEKKFETLKKMFFLKLAIIKVGFYGLKCSSLHDFINEVLFLILINIC